MVGFRVPLLLFSLIWSFGLISCAESDWESDSDKTDHEDDGYEEDEPLTESELHRFLGLLGLEGKVGNEEVHTKTNHDKETIDSHFRYHSDAEINDRIFFFLNATDPKQPRFCQIAFGDLTWTMGSTYKDLLTDCISKGKELLLSDSVANDGRKNVTIAHEVTKTGSTTIRRQIFQKLHKMRTCTSPEAHAMRPGYQYCHSIPDILADCPEIESFMFGPKIVSSYPRPCFDYSDWNLEEDYHFIHTIAYREFSEWAHSAMNQVIKTYMLLHHPEETNTDNVCKTFRQRFAPGKCKGWFELNYQKYTKSILRNTLREAPESHTILLHHYHNSTFLQTDIRKSLGLRPLDMSKEMNSRHTNFTCPADVLESFHACFDDLV